MTKGVKTSIVGFDDFNDLDFVSPSRWFIFTSMNDYLFIHVRDRQVAQDYIDVEYGKGRYKIRTVRVIKSKNGLTVSGTETRRK
jgi:hypothetical protein